MKRKLAVYRSVAVCSAAVLAFAAASSAYAYKAYPYTWEGIYPNSASYDNAGCQLCHQASTEFLNPYGADIAFEDGDIGDRIKAVANSDSDKDPTGSENLTEINADTQPGWAVGAEVPDTVNGDLDPITENAVPVADAGGPYNATLGDALTFDGSKSEDSDGKIVFYEWDFGDGIVSPSEEPRVTYTYPAAGTYTVTLTVTDDLGGAATDETTATIADDGNQPPLADAGGPYSGLVGQSVTFDGSASRDPDGTLESYEWDFGDGSFGTGVGPTHVYAETGTYNVTLTVEDDDGAADSDGTTAKIDVVVVNVAPVADAGGPYAADLGDFVQFDGSGSSDADGSIESYSWDFGDGTSGSGETPSHLYGADGSYTVTLTVTDDDGATDSATTTATIIPPVVEEMAPEADAGGPYEGTVNVAVEFDASDSYDPDGSIVDYTWDFGDGQTGSGLDPIHVYRNDGEYDVTLTVTDDVGLTDADETTATIGKGNRPPESRPGGPYTGKVAVALELDGSESVDPDGTIVAYDWDFGDGNLGTGVNPIHTYDEEGTYNVTLTVTDDADAIDSAMTTATITGDAIVDLDIVKFRTLKKVRLVGEDTMGIRIQLMVQNVGEVDEPRPATVVGVQNGEEVYNETLLVSAEVAGAKARYLFPAYVPRVLGEVVWTATVHDDMRDIDEASATTLVALPKNGASSRSAAGKQQRAMKSK